MTQEQIANEWFTTPRDIRLQPKCVLYYHRDNITDTQMCFDINLQKALGIQFHQVHCRARRLGGGFGGKETRFHLLAGSVATAAVKFNQPVRCMLDRDEDMIHSGTRHPFLAKYKVGFNGNGRINSGLFIISILSASIPTKTDVLSDRISVDMKLYQNSGYSMDLSMGTLSRAVDHSWNTYNFPNFRVKGSRLT